MSMMTQPMTSSGRMRARQQQKHNVSGLFVFLLIAAYAMFSLLLVLIGVQAYQSTVSASERNAELRTTIGYISGRVRASAGQVSVRREGEYTVMRIGGALGEEDYETRIYFAPFEDAAYGGLYEQVIDKEEEFDPDLGELIAEIGGFDMNQQGDLYQLILTTKDGAEHSMHLRLLENQVAPEGGEAA